MTSNDLFAVCRNIIRRMFKQNVSELIAVCMAAICMLSFMLPRAFSADDTPVVTAKSLLELPIKWKVAAGPRPVYPSGRLEPVILRYGTYAFAVDTKSGVFVPDESQPVITLIGWDGKEVKKYRIEDEAGNTGPFSDIIYHDGILYAGLARQLRIVIFDVNTEKMMGDIKIAVGNSLSDNDLQGENGFKPVIARLGVDHKGKIHVIFRIHPIGSSKYVKATIGLDGKREKVDFLISAASISNYPILEQGVIGQDGNWFHPCMIETPLGEGAYIGRNTIWKLTLNGNLIAYNALDTVFDDQLASIIDLIGTDANGNVYAFVSKSIDPRRVAGESSVYLVVFNDTGTSILAKIAREYPRRQVLGFRKAVVTDNGEVYVLMNNVDPEKPGDIVAPFVSRIWPLQ